MKVLFWAVGLVLAFSIIAIDVKAKDKKDDSVAQKCDDYIASRKQFYESELQNFVNDPSKLPTQDVQSNHAALVGVLNDFSQSFSQDLTDYANLKNKQISLKFSTPPSDLSEDEKIYGLSTRNLILNTAIPQLRDSINQKLAATSFFGAGNKFECSNSYDDALRLLAVENEVIDKENMKIDRANRKLERGKAWAKHKPHVKLTVEQKDELARNFTMKCGSYDPGAKEVTISYNCLGSCHFRITQGNTDPVITDSKGSFAMKSYDQISTGWSATSPTLQAPNAPLPTLPMPPVQISAPVTENIFQAEHSSGQSVSAPQQKGNMTIVTSTGLAVPFTRTGGQINLNLARMQFQDWAFADADAIGICDPDKQVKPAPRVRNPKAPPAKRPAPKGGAQEPKPSNRQQEPGEEKNNANPVE